MKHIKIIKVFTIVTILVAILMTLTGCNKKEKETKEIMSYLNEKYPNSSFEIVGEIQNETYKKENFNFSIDGSSAEFYKSYGKYYRLKIKSKNDGVEFYAQHLTKDNIFEDNYVQILNENNCKQKIEEKMKEFTKSKTTVTLTNNSVIDNKTRFSDKIIEKYEIEIDEDFNPFQLESVKDTVDLIATLNQIKRDYEVVSNDGLAIYNHIYIKYNNCESGEVNWEPIKCKLDKDAPSIEELEKLQNIEKSYEQLKAIFKAYNFFDNYGEFGVITISYNKMNIIFNPEKIYIQIPINYKNGLKGFEKGGEYTLKEFCDSYRESLKN